MHIVSISTCKNISKCLLGHKILTLYKHANTFVFVNEIKYSILNKAVSYCYANPGNKVMYFIDLSLTVSFYTFAHAKQDYIVQPSR